MIPEILGWDLSHPDWQDKKRAILQASAHICVSENTKQDLLKIYPKINPANVRVIWNSYDRSTFKPASSQEIIDFHSKYGIDKPYFLMVGPRLDYKNAQMLFAALSMFPAQHGYGVFCTGQDQNVLDYGRTKTGSQVYGSRLENKELAAAYSGAVGLVFPSVYEGFGLPLVEAMACHCPIIAFPTGASVEVAKDAAIYAQNPEDLCAALCEIQKPKVRRELISRGVNRVNQFSWTRSAQAYLEFFSYMAGKGDYNSANLGNTSINSSSMRPL
jgi:glycosyltransferase involved in cell wall biosynthesis